MTINDLPEEAKEELRKILREDILRSYHSGDLGKELGEEIEKGLRDEEILAKYDNEGC
jgi:NAD+--asparagine ADP-ribosyltransferase